MFTAYLLLGICWGLFKALFKRFLNALLSVTSFLKAFFKGRLSFFLSKSQSDLLLGCNNAACKPDVVTSAYSMAWETIFVFC